MIELTGVTIPKEVRSLVSVNLLKKYQCIPFELDPYNANILHLAMADPMDMAAIDDISIVTNLQVEPYIATPRDILAAIDRCYGASENMDAARRFTREREQLRGNVEEAAETDVSDAPIVQLVRSLIEQAVRQRASDIHIEALETKVRVRYRIDGALYEKTVSFRQSPPVSRLWAGWTFRKKESRRTDVCPLWLTAGNTISVFLRFRLFTARRLLCVSLRN